MEAAEAVCVGKRIKKHEVLDLLTQLVEEAGIPRIWFHDLRHTQGTVLANAGVAPQIVQCRLGPSRITWTCTPIRHPARTLPQPRS